MILLKIFLASSEELKQERLIIAELITTLNYFWAKYDIVLRLIKWEYLDSSMGVQHKQEDYNDYLRECDMCIVLFWTKFGKYTEIELQTAYQLLTTDSSLNQMCVMFKDGGTVTNGLKCFRETFDGEHPDLCCSFENESQLKELFTRQIIQSVAEKIEKEHEVLEKTVKKTKKLLAITEEDEPEYKEYRVELQEAQKELSINEGIIEKLKTSVQNI